LVLLVASALTALMVLAPGGGAIAASAQWAIQTSPNHAVPGGQFDSVSCASAEACTAVGNYLGKSGITNTLAESWNGTAWHKEAIPDPPGDNVPAVDPDLTGVSCPSADFCEAVGGYAGATGLMGMILAETWDGTSWALQSVPAPAGSTSASLSQVSCTSATFCEAVGTYASASNLTNPFAEMWNGTAWTAQSTPSPAGETIGTLGAVSCVSATFCEAAGGSPSFADTWDGTSWQLQSVPSNVGVGDLSCTSADFCESVDSSAGAVWNGATWSAQTFPALTGYYVSLTRVSCLSPTSCEATGSYTNDSGPYYALAAAWNGTAWTLQSAPSPAGAYQTVLDGVSCAAADLCETVGTYQATAQAQPTALAEGWNGSSWTAQQAVTPAGAVLNSLSAVSCVSARHCEAVGSTTDSSGNTISLAEKWDGTAWSIQATPDPTEASSAFRASMAGVSCVSATFCEAVGSSSANPGAAAWVWNGTSWSAQTIAGSSYLASVSCPSADFCMAVSGDGDANVWNGTSWSAQSATAAGFSFLYSVSCTSADFCAAVGYNSSGDNAETWNGSTWTAQPTPTPAGGSSLDLKSVSCVTPDSCETVGWYFSSTFAQLTVAEKWNGTAWKLQTTPNGVNSTDNSLLGVWCTSASSCTSVGFTEPNIINETLAEVWNGTSWSLQSTPNPPNASNNALDGVSCSAAGSCTAVGYTTDRGSISATLVEVGD
jgi:hypothetical protein